MVEVWTAPFVATTNDIISSSDANAGYRGNLLYLRQFLSANPAASNYWLQSTGANGASWVDRVTAVVAALFNAQLTGPLVFANGPSNGVRALNSGAVQRAIASVDVDNILLGDPNAAAVVVYAALNHLYTHDGTTLRQIWTEGNFDPTLKSDTSHLHTGVYSVAAHTHTFPTGAAHIATGTYTGTNSGAKVVTGLGFTPKLLFVQKTTVSSLAGFLASHDMVTFLPPNVGFGVAAGTLDADGFTLNLTSGYNAAANYAWIAFG